MYVEQTELEAPKDLDGLARRPGGVSFRLWRDVDAPGRYVLLACWLKREHADRAGATGSQAYSLLDMAWGHEADQWTRPGIYADHITAWVAPGKWGLWRPYARCFVSVMARQPGIIAEEMWHSHTDPLEFVALRAFVSREAARVGPELDPPEEVKLATQLGEASGVYQGAPEPRYRMLELVGATWGLSGRSAYERYIRGLPPV